MTEHVVARPAPAAGGWRPRLGLLLFILALVSPLMVPFVLAGTLPDDFRAALAGLLLFGLPMALMLIVVGLIGQPAFAFIKRHIPGQDQPPAAVGKGRYRLGLGLVAVAVVCSWLEPLLSPRVAAIEERRVLIGALSDALVLIGLCVLGGAFWDKVHALFVHSAHVVHEPGATAAAETEAVQVGWRFYTGLAVLVLSLSLWGLLPLASRAGWSTGQIASLSGGVFIATKVLLITAIAIMGKAGFNHVKRIVFGALSKFGPAHDVAPGRYRLGLVLFMVPMLMTWIAPYVTGTLFPEGARYLQESSLELILLVGLFLLGGDFWDKLRSLFQSRARVVFDGRPAVA